MSERKMSLTEKKELIAGALAFLFALFLLGAVGARKSVGTQQTGTYLLSARFNTVDGLSLGADVRIAGINVGKVVSLKLDEHFGVIVSMGIGKKILLPDDSSASIQSHSLVGTKYIEIIPGGSEDILEENDEISYTEDAINILDLADKALSMAKKKKKKKD